MYRLSSCFWVYSRISSQLGVTGNLQREELGRHPNQRPEPPSLASTEEMWIVQSGSTLSWFLDDSRMQRIQVKGLNASTFSNYGNNVHTMTKRFHQ